MKNKIVGWLLVKRGEMLEKKRPHRCSDCDEISSPVRRMSVLNLLSYVVLGIIVGGLTLYKIGFIVTMIAIIINAVKIQSACSSCFSTNIQLISWEEIKQLKADSGGNSSSQSSKDESLNDDRA